MGLSVVATALESEGTGVSWSGSAVTVGELVARTSLELSVVATPLESEAAGVPPVPVSQYTQTPTNRTINNVNNMSFLFSINFHSQRTFV